MTAPYFDCPKSRAPEIYATCIQQLFGMAALYSNSPESRALNDALVSLYSPILHTALHLASYNYDQGYIQGFLDNFAAIPSSELPKQRVR